MLGGLVPELLCSTSAFRHAGTTDIDVQVDLEIACGSVNTTRLEQAARDPEIRQLHSHIGGVERVIEVNVAGLAGFLLAKILAAHSRRKPKDWYDVAFVLLHNDSGGSAGAARRVIDAFGADLAGTIRSGIDDLHANFADPAAQGPRAYAGQMLVDHPELDEGMLLADAVTAIDEFCLRLDSHRDRP